MHALNGMVLISTDNLFAQDATLPGERTMVDLEKRSTDPFGRDGTDSLSHPSSIDSHGSTETWKFH